MTKFVVITEDISEEQIQFLEEFLKRNLQEMTYSIHEVYRDGYDIDFNLYKVTLEPARSVNVREGVDTDKWDGLPEKKLRSDSHGQEV